MFPHHRPPLFGRLRQDVAHRTSRHEALPSSDRGGCRWQSPPWFAGVAPRSGPDRTAGSPTPYAWRKMACEPGCAEQNQASFPSPMSPFLGKVPLHSACQTNGTHQGSHPAACCVRNEPRGTTSWDTETSRAHSVRLHRRIHLRASPEFQAGAADRLIRCAVCLGRMGEDARQAGVRPPTRQGILMATDTGRTGNPGIPRTSSNPRE